MPCVISTLDGQAFQVNVSYDQLRNVLFTATSTQVEGMKFQRDKTGVLQFIEFAEGDNQTGPMTILPSNIVNIQPSADDAAAAPAEG